MTLLSGRLVVPGFSISQEGRLTFAVTNPNYEMVPDHKYVGNITAADIHNASAMLKVTVNIVNQPEPGKITFSLSESGDGSNRDLDRPRYYCYRC